MALDHLVLLALDRRLLTEEHRRDMLTLADRVREELGISLDNSVCFSETGNSDIIGALSHWHFASEEDLKNFRTSRAHLDHLERMKAVLLDRQILDLFPRTEEYHAEKI